jgi:TonB family protein
MKMRNLSTICGVTLLLVFVGLGCKYNPLAKYTKQYNCTIAGEPEPQTSEEYLKRANRHIADNNYSADYNECAFGAASEAVRLDAKNADALALRGFLYKARAALYRDEKIDADEWKRSLELALDDLNDAIRLAPDRPNFYEIRMSIYDEGGFLDKSNKKVLEDLTKAIELSSPGKSLLALYVKRADYYMFYENYENAVKDYTEAIKLEPEDAQLYSKRSQAYWKLGKQDLSVADDMKVFQLKDVKEGKTNVNNSSDTTADNSSNDKKIPKTISGGVLNGKATSLPKPVYPPAAKAVRASGAVTVQVTVDEKGDVVSASALSGHPLLRQSAESAARQAKFSPTLLSGTAVKVTGVIVYNFVL